MISHLRNRELNPKINNLPFLNKILINRFQNEKNIDYLYELIELNKKNIYLKISADPNFKYYFIKPFKCSKKNNYFEIKGIDKITKKEPWIFFKILSESNKELYNDEATKISHLCNNYMVIPSNEYLDYNIIENDTFLWLPKKTEIFEKILNMKLTKEKSNHNLSFLFFGLIPILIYLIILFI